MIAAAMTLTDWLIFLPCTIVGCLVAAVLIWLWVDWMIADSQRKAERIFAEWKANRPAPPPKPSPFEQVR